jgi:hypothetical protein
MKHPTKNHRALVLAALVLLGPACATLPFARAQDTSQVPERLIKAFQNVAVRPGVKTPGTNGDIWPVTWADDDAMYSVCCDTDCFGLEPYDGVQVGQNAAFCRITGTPNSCTVKPLNPMKQLGKGGLYHGHKGAWKTSGMLSVNEARKLKLNFDESAGSWKTSGILSIKGRLYLAIFHHRYVTETERWPWWTATDASIIHSDDHGATWSPIPEMPMFEGAGFGNPSFIQYGKDYGLAPNKFVYAVSAGEGRWTNNDHFFLGRVSVDSIEKPEAWQFFSGVENGSPKWGSLKQSKPIVTAPRCLGCAPDVVWNPFEKAYMLVTFSVPTMPDDTDKATVSDAIAAHLERTLFHLYIAEKPWGPWRLVYSGPGPGEVDYTPRIPVKWLERPGEAWLLSGGNFGRVPYFAEHYGAVVAMMTWGNSSAANGGRIKDRSPIASNPSIPQYSAPAASRRPSADIRSGR